jgi:hypothetical protein
MKLFDIDWLNFIERLTVWEQLSRKARRAFAELDPREGLATAALHGQEQLLVNAGFVEYYAARQRLRLTKSCYPFTRAIRAMVRHDLLTRPDADTLVDYLRNHFSGEELAALGRGSYYRGHGIEHELVPQVTSLGWVERSLAELVKKRGRPAVEKVLPSWLKFSKQPPEPAADPDVTKRLVRHLMELPEPMPLAELPGRWDDMPGPALGAAIRQGIERLVLFATMRQEDMIPVLGLWPSIHRRLHRPKLKAPEPVQPQNVFHGAFLVEDMTTVLVAATARPLRLRGNDFALFAKAQRDLEAGLMSVPAWVTTAMDYPPEQRIPVAVQWLHILGLVRQAGARGEDLRLQATRKGEAWLAEPAKGRLRTVVDCLRSPPAKTGRSTRPFVSHEDDWGDRDEYAEYPAAVGFLPSTVRISGSDSKDGDAQLRRTLVSVFGTLPGEQFVPLGEFVGWQTQESNPLMELLSGGNRPMIYAGWSYRQATDEDLEGLWGQLLEEMIQKRLAPLGGAGLGMVEGSKGVCFALTDAGRYLLGMAEDFDYGHESEAQGQVVVQPNFEVVFLAPSPLAEAALARFAERKGRGVGALFTITKKSILAAAGSGMKAAQVLETLQRLSAKPVPANVAREIAGWFKQCRRIQVRSTVLIQCPDADTAARVVGASGKRATTLTDTVVELPDARAKTELLRKLHGLGIFTDRPSSAR